MKRRGRPELKEEEFRKPRSFKATDAEWEQIKSKAKAAGINFTQVFSEAIFAKLQEIAI